MGILIIVCLFAVGMGLGYLFRKKLKEPVVSRTTTIIIYLLLFMLGVSVGGNETVMSSLDTIGLHAVIITAGAMIGSMIMAWIIYKFIYKGIKTKTEESDER